MENSSYIQDKGKDIQDLERYGYIVDYFKRNKGRVSVNRGYLKNLSDLSKLSSLKNFRAHYIKVEFDILEDRIREILEQDEKNLRTKLKFIEVSRKDKLHSGTGIGVGVYP